MKIKVFFVVLFMFISSLNVTSQYSSYPCSSYDYVSSCSDITNPSVCSESYVISNSYGYLCEWSNSKCSVSDIKCSLNLQTTTTTTNPPVNFVGKIFLGLNLTPSGNISQGGSNFGTLPFGNGSGNISAGSGITSDRILGLSKDFFFKLAGLIIITIVALTIKPLHITAFAVLLCYIVIISPLKFFTIPDSLLVFITVVTLIELLRRSSL